MRVITIIMLSSLLSLIQTVSAETVVYTAKLVRTMEPALPEATAVAVEDGKVQFHELAKVPQPQGKQEEPVANR